MNTPNPAAGPPAAPSTTASTLPTAGALIGSVVGSVLASALKLDPVSAGSVVAGVTTLFTAVFHFLGTKIGAPL